MKEEWKPSPWEGCDCSQCEESRGQGFQYDTREEEELDREIAGLNEPEWWEEDRA